MDSNQRLPPCQGDTLPTELRGQKRNGSISKKSLNSKQILIFRKIPPKFYHLALAEILYKISPRRQIPSKFYTKFHYFAKIPMPKSCAKFHDLSKIRVKFNGANSRRSINLRQIRRDFGAFRLDVATFYSSLREPHVPFVRPVPPRSALRLAKTPKFSHSALEFLRFAASRPDRFVSCSRAYHRVLAYLDRARSYRIRGGFLYKFCFL